MEEIWKDIEGYEGLYQVSNLGRVKSLDRYVEGSYNKRFLQGKIMKQCKNRVGYATIGLCKKGKQKMHFVHRLVAGEFIQNKDDLPEINHKDGNKQNNRVENLEWCNRSQNLEHSYRVLGRKNRVKIFLGKQNPLHKEVIQFSEDGKEIARYYGIREASRKTGISSGDICNCCNGKLKQSHGYIWKYKEE